MIKTVSAFFLVTVAVFGFVSTSALALECPAQIDLTPAAQVHVPNGWQQASDGTERHWLINASLFEGPISENQELVPVPMGERTQGWELFANANFNLVCRYEGTEFSISKAVPTGAKVCTVVTSDSVSRGIRGGRVVTDMQVKVECK